VYASKIKSKSLGPFDAQLVRVINPYVFAILSTYTPGKVTYTMGVRIRYELPDPCAKVATFVI